MTDNQEIQDKKPKKRSRNWLYPLLALIVLGCAYLGLSMMPTLAFGSIEIQGRQNITKEEILTSAGLKGTTNILAVNRAEVSRRLQQDARIELISEGYQWPFSYVITLRERNVNAYIPTADGFVAVDRTGKVLQVQRRFSHMSAPIVCGVTLPSLLIGETVSDEGVRTGLLFLVKVNEQGNSDLSELNLENTDAVMGYTLRGTPIALGRLSELEDKAETAAQVLREVEGSGRSVRYMDLKSKVPVVKFN